MTNVFVPTPIDHGALSGLSDDDHTIYLLVSGTRAMAGNLNMGGFAITNVGLVDGVDVSGHGSRHAAAGADPLTLAADSRILGRAVGAGAGAVQELTADQVGAILDASTEFVRRDGTTPLTANWDAGSFTITADHLTADAANALVYVGAGTGSTSLWLDASDAGTDTFNLAKLGVARFQAILDGSETVLLRSRDGASAITGTTTIANATHLWTYPGSSTWGSASPVRTLGNHTGTPGDNYLKDEAGEYIATFYSEAQPRWQFPYFPTDESMRVVRLSTAGAFVNTALAYVASDTVGATSTVYNDHVQHFNDASVYWVLGDGTSSPVGERRKSDAGSTWDGWCVGAGASTRWQAWAFDGAEALFVRRINTDGSTQVNDPLTFLHTNTLSATMTTLSDAIVYLSYPDVFAHVGNGNGAPQLWIDADGTSISEFVFVKDGAVSDGAWRFEHDSSELFAIQHRTGGVWVDALDFDASHNAQFSENLHVAGQIFGDGTEYAPSGTTQTIDWDDGNVHWLALLDASGNVTVTLSNPEDRAVYYIAINNDASSTRNVTWPANVWWPGGTPISITHDPPGGYDLVRLVYFAAIGGGVYLATYDQNLLEDTP